MRQLTDAARLRQFMHLLGTRSRSTGRVYLVGGACKEELQVNVELASPAHFIPELPGWRDRSPFVMREGTIDFHHYDFYAQALSKIERAHTRDLDDVRTMAAQGLVEPTRLMGFFEQIVPELYRYPAIDPASFRRAVEGVVQALRSQ